MKHIKRDVISIFWMASGLFVGLALFSYYPGDPSFNVSSSSVKIQNYCGYVGSYIADLFYQLLGMSAWVFVAICVRFSALYFSGRTVHYRRLSFFWGVLLVLVSAALVSLHWPEFRSFSDQVTSGGVLGSFFMGQLVEVFSPIGVGVLLWAVFLILMVFYTEKTLVELTVGPIKRAGGAAGNIAIWSTESTKRAVGGLPRPSLPSLSNLFRRKKSESLEGHNFYAIDAEETLVGEEEGGGRQLKFNLRPKKIKKRKVKLKARVNTRIENWELPKISLLDDPPVILNSLSDREVKKKSELLVNKLEMFNVRGKVAGVSPGPAVTLFEFKPNADVKISKITELADDLSLALSSESVRIIAPIPGRDVVGIETSNSNRETVYLKDILAYDPFWDEEIRLPIALGREADGTPKVVDLRKMPHLLVAGSTGSGKSVFTVSTLISLLYRHSPKTLKLILVDPKQVDLAAFENIPHLLMPLIKEPKKAIGALRWAIREMEKRYRSMSKFGARGLEAFNEIVAELDKEEQKEHEEANELLETPNHPESYYWDELPYIVIVVEEFGDLMAVDKSNVEQAVVRLAQMARACGIHLVLAMQSPRKDVVTGLIKTNIPGRVSFKVASKMDSRIILDESGAERLLSRGDMLFLAPGVSKPKRHHGPWLSDPEIAQVVGFWEQQGTAEFDPLFMKHFEGGASGSGGLKSGGLHDSSEDYDEMYDEIVSFVSAQKKVSASLLQRRFRLGYPRAARLIEVMESEGVVGPANGSKPREVLVKQV